MKVGIVTDSLSNLPPDLAKQYDIYIVYGSIYIDNKKYIANVEVSTDQILEIISKKTLKTAVPSPGDFYNIYEQILDKYDIIISLHCPTKQTAFLKSAKLGAKRTRYPEKIIHIECGVATLGLGLVAISTAILAREINDLDLLLKKIDSFCKRVDVLGALNSFDYIKRSGRVKLKFLGTVASIIAIKPVLAMHGSNIMLLERTFNREKALEKLQYQFQKRFDPSMEPKMIGLSHLKDLQEAEKIKSNINKKYPSHEVIFTDVDPMIASNTGPGLMLLTFFSKPNI